MALIDCYQAVLMAQFKFKNQTNEKKSFNSWISLSAYSAY